jgi:hypothetical protein
MARILLNNTSPQSQDRRLMDLRWACFFPEPRQPKDDPDLATRREIESLPVFKLFKHHLKDFEGGSRNPNVAKDHT